MCGWIDNDNKAISVQLNLTGTATGTELGKMLTLTSDRFQTFLEIETILMSTDSPRQVSKMAYLHQKMLNFIQ